MQPLLTYSFVVVALLIGACERLSAQTSNVGVSERDEFQDELLDYEKKKLDIFSSAPISHVIPKRNTIFLAAEIKLVDIAVGPSSNTYYFADVEKHELSVKGWDASPLVAFAAKNFGIGFAAEGGLRETSYTVDTSGYFTQDKAKMTYSGAGAYLYYIPTFNFLPKYITSTLIFGGKSLAAIHNDYGNIYYKSAVADSVKLRYDVRKWEAGVNVGFALIKRFTVIPWFRYEQTTLGAVRDADGNQIDSEFLNIDDDRDLMWHLQPAHRGGIDFAVRLANLEIRFGGILGVLGSLYAGNDRITDNGISVGLSYDFKGQ